MKVINAPMLPVQKSAIANTPVLIYCLKMSESKKKNVRNRLTSSPIIPKALVIPALDVPASNVEIRVGNKNERMTNPALNKPKNLSQLMKDSISVSSILDQYMKMMMFKTSCICKLTERAFAKCCGCISPT